MARIFVALYNFCKVQDDGTSMPPFFESFLDGLKRAGNQVLCFQTKKVTNRGFNKPIPQELLSRVKGFDPELCILFNNNFWDISDVVECPIVIYDVDSPIEYQMKDNLKKKVGRYHFVVNQTASFDLLHKIFGISPKQYVLIPFFSEVRADSSAEKKRNIGFVGANWIWKGSNFFTQFMRTHPTHEDIVKAQKVIERFVQYPFKPSHEIYQELGLHPHYRMNLGDLRRASFEISGYRRLRYLSAVADLGLEIHGNNYWTIDAMNYFPEVLACFNSDPLWTLKDNQDFYNSSRIALNTNHIQAQNGFSFRVCDILASDACLVSEKKEDINLLFPGVGIPEFESPAEAREKCLMILNNESMRQDIVAAAHEAIDKNFRFANVLEKLEQFMGMTLHSSEVGELEILPPWNDGEAKNVTITPAQKAYYDILGKHLGYDPYHLFPKKVIQIGKIPVCKILQTTPERKEVFIGPIPVISSKTAKGSVTIRLLAAEKCARLIKKAAKRLRLTSAVGPRNLLMRAKKSLRIRQMRQKIKAGVPLRIVLFVSRTSCWVFEDLYQLLKNSGVFEPVVVVKPFMSRGMQHMKECMRSTLSELTARGYHPIAGYDETTDTFLDVRQAIDPDIVFYTKYWKPHFHKYFYIDRFRDRLCFLTDYGYNVSNHTAAMNFELQNEVDAYFYFSEKQISDIQAAMDNHGKNIVVTGSMKIAKLFDPGYTPVDVWKSQKTRKKRIIWAPHHEDKTGMDMYQYDAFYDLYDMMFEIAEQYKDRVQFAFKPHPLLKTKLDKYWGTELREKYYARWANLENAQLEEGEFIDLFLTSDAMILDSISFIAEYTATKKPALFTIGSHSRTLFNTLGKDLFNMMYHAYAKENMRKSICTFIEDVVIDGKDIYAVQRSAYVDAYLAPPYHQTAAENVYQGIMKCIEGQ